MEIGDYYTTTTTIGDDIDSLQWLLEAHSDLESLQWQSTVLLVSAVVSPVTRWPIELQGSSASTSSRSISRRWRHWSLSAGSMSALALTWSVADTAWQATDY